MIIGFAKNTSKVLPRILCKKYKHCSLIFKLNDDMVMLAIALDGIRLISLGETGLNKLSKAGWDFIKISETNVRNRGEQININERTSANYQTKKLNVNEQTAMCNQGKQIIVNEQTAMRNRNNQININERKSMRNRNNNLFKFPIFLSCVGIAKKAIGINNPFIWTPYQLHKYLLKQTSL